MEVLLEIEHGQERIEDLPIKPLAHFAMDYLDLPASAEVSITFVNNDTIADLNSRYRSKEGPTDVLSFECDNIKDSFPLPGGADAFDVYTLGDVIIATDVASAQAQEYGNSLEDEVSLLLVHGILHLCGYDHIEDDDAQVMEEMQKEILFAWKNSASKEGRIDEGIKVDTSDCPLDSECFVYHAGQKRNFAVRGAFKFAFEGIAYALSSQRNIKVHLVIAALAIILGFVLQIDTAGWLAIVICIFLTLSLELANTAIESLTDLVSDGWNILAKRTKDCAAGAVCISAFGSVVVACIVFGPKIVDAVSALFAA